MQYSTRTTAASLITGGKNTCDTKTSVLRTIDHMYCGVYMLHYFSMYYNFDEFDLLLLLNRTSYIMELESDLAKLRSTLETVLTAVKVLYVLIIVIHIYLCTCVSLYICM